MTRVDWEEAKDAAACAAFLAGVIFFLAPVIGAIAEFYARAWRVPREVALVAMLLGLPLWLWSLRRLLQGGGEEREEGEEEIEELLDELEEEWE